MTAQQNPAKPYRSAEPLLVLDAGGPGVHVGILHRGEWLARRSTPANALEALFGETEALFRESGFTLESAGGFLFRHGPGSILGLRLAAMAIRTWQALVRSSSKPVYHYHALGLAALAMENPDLPGWVVTDWTRDRWLAVSIFDPLLIQEIEASTLAECPPSTWYHLPGPRSWQPAPRDAQPISYPWHALPRFLEYPGFLVESPLPELLYPGKSTYQRWESRRHRAATPPSL